MKNESTNQPDRRPSRRSSRRASTTWATWGQTCRRAFLVVDPQTIANLVALNYSRAQESEADETAMKLLDSAKIDHYGLLRFFERDELKPLTLPNTTGTKQNIYKLDKVASIFSTHPLTADRIEQIKSYKRINEVAPEIMQNLTLTANFHGCSQ